MYTSWQQELSNVITDPNELFSYLQLDLTLLDDIRNDSNFKLKVPYSYLKRIKPKNLDDPLLKQVLPISEEQKVIQSFTNDPLQEISSTVQSGLLHKYHGRVLLIVTGSCAIHCRYCFRKHFPYNDHNQGHKGLQANIDYIASDNSIFEVILSGGDPLQVNDKYLGKIIAQLEQIEHLTTLRIHTRLPVVIPNRITQELINTLTSTRLKIVMVLHINHAQEIDEAVITKTKHLTSNGITLFNQSVLLKGVNDNSESICTLSKRLFTIGVIPYYLHILDRVSGSSHFEVDVDTAKQIMNEVINELPGYMIPRLVQEKPHLKAKYHINLES